MKNFDLLVAAFIGLCNMQMTRLNLASGLARQLYHGAGHPTDVFRGARRVAITLLGKVGFALVEMLIWMACAAHDYLQEATEVTAKNGFRVRARDRGPNEMKSAE